MHIPQGYNHHFAITSTTPLVYKLNKSIYGLKQTSRIWLNKFSVTLISYGLKNSKSDYTLFTKGIKCTRVVVLVYVDDIIITSLGPLEITNIIKIRLHDNFKLKNLGDLKFFLGLKF